MNPTRLLRSLAAAVLLASPLAAATPDPASAKGPFTVAGTLQGISLQEVASRLDGLVAITHAGDDRLFLTLRGGEIVILRNGTVQSRPFLDIRSRVSTAGEGGLLSVAFHPRYAANGFFFVNYTNTAGDTVIERFQVSSNDPDRADLASRRTLLTIVQPFSNHNGGQIQFGPDGYLYIGMGDGGAAFDPACRAQRNDTLLGKMLRIDVDQNVESAPFYGIPFDNPFRGIGGAADMPDEVWAIGLRNPWRFSFDRLTGDLWIGDVGQGQREEIDLQPAASRGGENYGWKMMEGTVCSSTSACPATVPPCNSSALTLPVLEYDHAAGCSVTGGYVYRGNSLPQLRGTYFFGDFCSGQIWAASRQGDGFQVRRLAQTLPDLVTFGEDRQGELYAASIGGRLFRLVGEGGGNPTPRPDKVGLFDPARTRFHLKSANSARASTQTITFGRRGSGWIPLAGDWDGDGKTTIGFYDPDATLFRLKNSLKGRTSDVLLRVDAPSGDVIALAGDWDGDGDDTVGLYDRTTDRFHLKNSLTGEDFDIVTSIGPLPGNLLPLAGDWDGDGLDTVGLYDPARSVFYLENGREDQRPDIEFQFGSVGSLPVAGDWDGNGRDGVGAYDARTGTFRLRNSLNAGAADAAFLFGPRRGGWRPLAGNW
ncbi:MAG TPA: PQQ-dependent sugar dehydrogenase [Thermoanaerobaculia bacterium]|nr:PQQ-dependent sugar dehydrogenase [Thermoanaerobaculia bacterium]